MTQTTLTPDVLQQLAAQCRASGEQDANDHIHDELHAAARSRVADLLQDAGFSEREHDIDSDQIEELTLAYKDGFWEPCHQAERRSLKNLLERAYRALHEDDFPALREDIRNALAA